MSPIAISLLCVCICMCLCLYAHYTSIEDRIKHPEYNKIFCNLVRKSGGAEINNVFVWHLIHTISCTCVVISMYILIYLLHIKYFKLDLNFIFYFIVKFAK